jgi:hypothetical protein
MIAPFEAEFANTLSVSRRPGNNLSSILRLAWDGDRLQTITKNSPETASNPHVSIVGHISIEELRNLADQTYIAGGLANRFLVVLTRRLYSIFTTMDWRRNAVEFNPEAHEMYDAEYPTLSAEHPVLFGLAINRAESQAERLAVIYALLDQSYLARPGAHPSSAGTIPRAVAGRRVLVGVAGQRKRTFYVSTPERNCIGGAE